MKIEINANSITIDGIEYEKKEQPTPKDGEVWYIAIGYWDWVCIHKSDMNDTRYYACYGIKDESIAINGFICSNKTPFTRRLATPKEIAFLHTKLKENGKVWNPDTKTLEDYRELREGELCIGWNKEKKDAIIGVLNAYRGNNRLYDYVYLIGTYGFSNAIPFVSIEQYEQFRKS